MIPRAECKEKRLVWNTTLTCVDMRGHYIRVQGVILGCCEAFLKTSLPSSWAYDTANEQAQPASHYLVRLVLCSTCHRMLYRKNFVLVCELGTVTQTTGLGQCVMVKAVRSQTVSTSRHASARLAAYHIPQRGWRIIARAKSHCCRHAASQ